MAGPIGPIGPAPNVAAANAFMLDQVGGPFNAVRGAPDGYLDCGPTTGVIALSVLGVVPYPRPAGAEVAIERMRQKMHPGSATSRATNVPQEIAGLQAMGAAALSLPPTMASVRFGLGRRSVVALGGDPKRAWGQQMSARGAYLENGRVDFGHWVAITGITPAGDFVVCDPLSRVGAFVATAAQLQTYLMDGAKVWGWNGCVEVSRGPGT